MIAVVGSARRADLAAENGQVGGLIALAARSLRASKTTVDGHPIFEGKGYGMVHAAGGRVRARRHPDLLASAGLRDRIGQLAGCRPAVTYPNAQPARAGIADGRGVN